MQANQPKRSCFDARDGNRVFSVFYCLIVRCSREQVQPFSINGTEPARPTVVWLGDLHDANRMNNHRNLPVLLDPTTIRGMRTTRTIFDDYLPGRTQQELRCAHAVAYPAALQPPRIAIATIIQGEF